MDSVFVYVTVRAWKPLMCLILLDYTLYLDDSCSNQEEIAKTYNTTAD